MRANTSRSRTSCDAGKYKSIAGADACSECPTYSHSTSGSDSISACTCNAGATGNDGGPCQPCEAGKFKVDRGNALCTKCDFDRFSTVVGSQSEGNCLNCPDGKKSEQGSDEQSDCLDICPPGQTGPAGSCIKCPAGKFKSESGPGSCVTCPANTNSEEGSSLCSCNKGYSGPDGGPCSTCAQGKYKNQDGPAECTTCS